ncbi:MAG TPA: hypothetical protein VGD43_25045 [Micromonospora sp.]
MSPTVLVVVIAVVFCFTIAGVVTIALAGRDDQESTITILVGLLAPTIASLVTLSKTAGVAARVEKVASDTDDLTNGLMDAKIRAAVADVLPDHQLDPEAAGQIADDRERRDRDRNGDA